MSRPTFAATPLVRIRVRSADRTEAARRTAHGVWCAMLEAMTRREIPSDVGPITASGTGIYTTYVDAESAPAVVEWLRTRITEERP